jgi:ribosomal protein L14
VEHAQRSVVLPIEVFSATDRSHKYNVNRYAQLTAFISALIPHAQAACLRRSSAVIKTLQIRSRAPTQRKDTHQSRLRLI